MPTPPVDMVMPYWPQMIFGFGNVIPIAIALWLCFRYLKSHGSAYGFLFLLAGAVTVLNEPVVDILGLCWFPMHGTYPLFEAWGVKIPWWMLPVYTWYVGGQAFYVYRRFEEGITTRGLFKLYLTFAVVNALLETPGLWLGVYAYYGEQPFQFLKFPYWWAVVNALMPMTMAALVFRLRPLLTGVRQFLIVPMGLMAAALTNGAIAAPVWISLNSGAGPVITHLAALVTLCFGLMFAYALSQLVATDAALPRAARDRVAAPGSAHAAIH
ncbi:MAG TPA: hypothetical protein VJM11_17085 [Nevskiaceae bacterium]|nr:hypothetical protein [Nevskiaceae bacterium]